MKRLEDPPVYTRLPFLRRARLRAILWLLKSLIVLRVTWVNFRSKSLPADQKPTLRKRYPNSPLPNSDVRVFIPKTYKAGDKPLPLFIDLHGGGFCMGNPLEDDKDNLIMCHQHGFCVVSIPYKLGPQYKFPHGHESVAGMITAVLADESLPVDRSRCAVGGFSAGGTMSITGTMALAPEVRAKVKGIAAYYPAVDQATGFDLKKQRQVLGPSGRDILHSMAAMFTSGYVPPGTKLDEPLLSPIYAARADLPAKISLLGCEYDVLCVEAQHMAEDLALQEPGEKVPLEGGRNGWTKGGIRWELIEKQIHGFHQIPINLEKTVDPKEKERATQRMFAGVAEWLKKEVFV
jgi:acetyl esterase/lipase